MLEGIDVSNWQATTPPLAGRSFVFARATYDTAPDARYAMHAANVKAAGLVLGAYHFGTGRSSPTAQAQAFLKVAQGAQLFCLDLEADPVPMTLAQARAFILAVKAAGRTCGLYHSDSGFPALGQDWNWVARWGTTAPVRPWAFWQYRGSPLDLDRFSGTQADLDRLAGITVAPGTVVALPPGAALYAHQGDTTPVGHVDVQYGFTVTKDPGTGRLLGTISCWTEKP